MTFTYERGPMIETSRVVAITPKGETVRQLYRFVHALRQLPADDQAEVLALAAEEIGDRPA